MYDSPEPAVCMTDDLTTRLCDDDHTRDDHHHRVAIQEMCHTMIHVK